MAYCIGLDACRFLKSNILLHVRVTHEDVWRQMLNNETNFKKLLSTHCFTPKLSTQRAPFVYSNVYNFKYFYASNGNSWPGFDAHKKQSNFDK